MPVNFKLAMPVLTDDANGIAQDQTTAGAGNLTLNGALVSGGVATAAAAQPVSIESAANLSAITFTVTGTDADGNSRSESLAGPNATTTTTTGHFATVTQVAVSAAVGTNVEVGWLAADGMATPTIPMDWKQNGFLATAGFNELVDGMTISGQYSLDDPLDSDLTPFQDNAWWVNITFDDTGTTTLAAAVADAVSSINFPVKAVRFVQTTGTTTATGTVYVIQGSSS